MQSGGKTVAAYLASLPEDRRAAITAVRDVIRKNLDAGYEEGEAVRRIPAKKYIARYESVLADLARAKGKKPAKKTSKARR